MWYSKLIHSIKSWLQPSRKPWLILATILCVQTLSFGYVLYQQNNEIESLSYDVDSAKSEAEEAKSEADEAKDGAEEAKSEAEEAKSEIDRLKRQLR